MIRFPRGASSLLVVISCSAFCLLPPFVPSSSLGVTGVSLTFGDLDFPTLTLGVLTCPDLTLDALTCPDLTLVVLTCIALTLGSSTCAALTFDEGNFDHLKEKWWFSN